ncbi:uncharacterized protein VDAG_08078 [Verticillium dahliae VdLs.17]|uniref:Zn(2)-C6 fungal-type domain-containing protein n=1 Tax=Verticillium dahliae (strain VdLs.17 / ATCC MYA-4575 / FGSC 10137) TaxID=498257 RepID=G2XD46_VERDV|nr:uncharacterized protein VDAG_08078 [Verticillium dahliae VdLs.17]EGY16914.1 hypothetical protein VDAG_08078 [Verticillium dahliae VdLs.17]
MSAADPSNKTAASITGAPPEIRRRSRDEKKPSCGSCQERNVTCLYKPLTWVADVQTLPAGSPNGHLGHPARHESSDPPLPTPRRGSSPSSASVGEAATRKTVARHHGRIHVDNASASYSMSPGAASARQVFTPAHVGTPHAFANTTAAQSAERAVILRSFRYDIAPIVDSSAPRSTFAVDVLELAQREDVIVRAIALVVQSRSMFPSLYPPAEMYTSEKERELLDELSTKDAPVAHVGLSLVTLGGFFGRPPSRWPNHMVRHPNIEPSDLFLHSDKEPLKSLVRFQIKIELANSLRTSRPLSEHLLSWVRRRQSLAASSSSPEDVHTASICHLARCIDLVNSRPSVFPAEHLGPLVGQTPDASTDFESAWSAYWAVCTHWYQTRPQDAVPILETTALEAAALTTDDPGFPVSIYSSPISLQSNTNMHLACLLLLKSRPGLSAAIRPRRPFESRSWHSEKIAGNAVWNTYTEQWDPLIIGALLLIAEEVTHLAQQLAVKECLQRISRDAGVDLQRETASLNGIWQAFRGDHDIDFDY